MKQPPEEAKRRFAVSAGTIASGFGKPNEVAALCTAFNAGAISEGHGLRLAHNLENEGLPPSIAALMPTKGRAPRPQNKVEGNVVSAKSHPHLMAAHPRLAALAADGPVTMDDATLAQYEAAAGGRRATILTGPVRAGTEGDAVAFADAYFGTRRGDAEAAQAFQRMTAPVAPEPDTRDPAAFADSHFAAKREARERMRRR